jgi:hypothetical protein
MHQKPVIYKGRQSSRRSLGISEGVPLGPASRRQFHQDKSKTPIGKRWLQQVKEVGTVQQSRLRVTTGLFYNDKLSIQIHPGIFQPIRRTLQQHQLIDLADDENQRKIILETKAQQDVIGSYQGSILAA